MQGTKLYQLVWRWVNRKCLTAVDRGAGQAAVFFFVTLKKDFDVLGPPVVVSLARSRVFDFVGAAQEDNSALLTPALTKTH